MRDIVVHGDDLVIGTHGRGIWIIDNINALRQLGPGSATGTRLFDPATAIRYREAAFTGTPLPKDEPTAANPHSGAAIDYLLASAAKKPVELIVRAADGSEVRRWSSAQKPAALDLSKLGNAPEWVAQPTPLAASPGMHRFIWSLHYPPVTGASNPYADGIWAPPGVYRVELVVDGKSYHQDLTVAADPRIDLPASAYADSFALARKVGSLQTKLAAAIVDAGNLGSSMRERLQKRDNTQPLFEDFSKRFNQVTGTTPSPNPFNAWSRPPNSTRSLAFIERSLGQLLAAIDDADAAPSADARAGYTKMTEMTEQSLQDWKRFNDEDVVRLNKALRDAGAAPLKPAKS